MPWVFEVTFPPTGPLGITFEWAVDPAAALPPPGRPSTGTAVPLESPSIGRQQERLLGMNNATTPFTGRSGSTPVSTPRAPPLSPSTLPPISSSPSSGPKQGADHPLEPPRAPAMLPHALRIQSFPRLEPQEMNSPRLVNPGGGTTAIAAGESSPPPGGELEYRAAATSSDRKGLLRVETLETSTQEERCTEGNAGPDANTSKVKDDMMSPVKSNNAATTGTTEQLGDTDTIGPVAGRDVLRHGDTLIEVNGSPLAGSAARDAGIISFEDAVRVVAAATAATAATTTTKGMKPIGGPPQRPRVFKFRREANCQRPTSASTSTSVSNPLLPAPKITSKEGWVKGTSGSTSGSGSSSRTAGDEQRMTKSPSRSTSVPQSRAAVGVAATAASATSSPRLSSSSLHPSVNFQRSANQRGSAASVVSRSSSKASKATRSTKRARDGKLGAGGSVLSAISATERIKAEAR